MARNYRPEGPQHKVSTRSIRALAAVAIRNLPTGLYLVHAVRFHPQKRHDLLLDALALQSCRSDGQTFANRMQEVVAVATGQIINPHGLTNKIEGGHRAIHKLDAA